MKKKIRKLGYWIEDKLKDLCGEITPDKRLTVILIMLLLFTLLNLYFTFTTIRNWGQERERRNQIKIEHIEGLELEKGKVRDMIDSEIETVSPENIDDLPDMEKDSIHTQFDLKHERRKRQNNKT